MAEGIRTVVGATISPASLLKRAAELFDAPGSLLSENAPGAGRRGFASGAEWMWLALRTLRGDPAGPAPGMARFDFQLLGVVKYGLACSAALAWLVAACWAGWPVLAPLAVLVFYAVEGQGVFLFPLALDGEPHPFRAARRWTVEAGGTLRVMAVVMPLAACMLAGGFLGRGFVRSWCLGCLAVCIWYEHLRLSKSSLTGTLS